MSVQPGWYPDPAAPSTQRYWDGDGWLGAPMPADATPPPGPPPVVEAERPAPAPEAPAGPAGSPAGPTNATPGGPPIPTGWPQPYLVPVPPPPRPHGLALAPLGARLVARLIDIGAVFLLNVAVNGWFVWQWVQEISPTLTEAGRRLVEGDRTVERPPPDARADNLMLVILLIAAALWFAYEVPALADNGQTFGKRVMGVKVVPMVGEQRLGLGRSFRRWNTLGLPVLLWFCCGIGLVLQLIDCAFPLFDRPLRQALHDKRAQTVVVRVPRQPTNPAAAPTDERTDTPGGSS